MPTIRPTRDYLFRRAPGLEDEKLQKLIGEQAGGLQGLLNELRARLTEIEEDKHLSREGKRERRREVVRELREPARNIGRVEQAERLRERVRTERETLRDPDFRLSEGD